jgi:hypothetical protein
MGPEKDGLDAEPADLTLEYEPRAAPPDSIPPRWALPGSIPPRWGPP